MLKSNSKKAIENIRAYIVEKSGEWAKERAEYDGKILAAAFFGDLAPYILRVFRGEKAFEVAAARSGRLRYQGKPAGEMDVFRDWLQGLSGGDLGDFYLCAARADLAAILEETPDEAARYTEEKAEETLMRLIYRELRKAE